MFSTCDFVQSRTMYLNSLNNHDMTFLYKSPTKPGTSWRRHLRSPVACLLMTSVAAFLLLQLGSSQQLRWFKLKKKKCVSNIHIIYIIIYISIYIYLLYIYIYYSIDIISKKKRVRNWRICTKALWTSTCLDFFAHEAWSTKLWTKRPCSQRRSPVWAFGATIHWNGPSHVEVSYICCGGTTRSSKSDHCWNLGIPQLKPRKYMGFYALMRIPRYWVV